MTSPRISRRVRPVVFLAAALFAAACGEHATAPADLTGAPGALSSNNSSGSSSTCKKDLTLDVQAFRETNGDVSVEFAIPEGLTVTKVSVKVFDEKGKHVGQFEFNKLSLTGNRSVVIPAKAGIQEGWSLTVTAHVKSCGGKETDIVRTGVTVRKRGGTGGIRGIDLSIVPILMANANPVLDRALEDGQIGVPTLYDVTISNSGSSAVDARCVVTVDGTPVPVGAQYWISGTGVTIGTAGLPISIPADGARICRFSVTYTTEGPHTLAVTAVAVGATEVNLANNTTSATIMVAPEGHAPLESYEFVLGQTEAVTVNPDGSVTSRGIIDQSVLVQSYWDEALTAVPGTDTWTFTVTSSSAGSTFDSRTVSVTAARFTTAEVEAATAAGTTACRLLLGESPSPTRPYLKSSVTVCALPKEGEPGTITIRFAYVAGFATSADTPYNGPDVLVWKTSFSFLADIQHSGASDVTVGGITQTVTLRSRLDPDSGIRLTP